MAVEKEALCNLEEIISAAEQREEKHYKTTEVKKLIEPHSDLGNLLLTDLDPFEYKNFK